MNKYSIYILSAFLFSGLWMNAQSRDYLDIKTLAGYEYNYFRSPKKVERDGILYSEDNVLASSIYQDFYLDYDLYYKWSKNQIKVGATPEARLFYENFDDSYWQVSSEVVFSRDLSENTEYNAEINFRKKDRQGLDGDLDVLLIPLGFVEYGAITGLEFSPFDNNVTEFEAFYNFKNYDNYGVRDLEYDEFGVNLDTEQVFEKNELTHVFGITSYLKKRLYNTFDASDEQPNGERDWSYFKLAGYYEYPLTKNFRVEPSFEYMQRIDNGRDRSGYTEYGPNLKLNFDNDRLDFWTTIEYLRRNYDAIEARDNNGSIGEFTQYGYTNFRLVGDYWLTKNWSMTADVYSKIRSSNYTDFSARSFRAYRNQYAGLGIKWKM